MGIPEEKYCSTLSTAAGEPLYGSAGRTEIYLLLEYNGAWEDKAFEKSGIPEEVKKRLAGLSRDLPASKILLIKRSPRTHLGTIHFFVVIANEPKPRLYSFEIRSYEELLDLDLAAVLQEDHKYVSNLQQDPLYLVCTNGRRDLCCARFGLPVFEALKEKVGEAVWECSHIGGHRFAPNIFYLPHGIMYGRVQPQEVEEFVRLTQAGQMHLKNLRGRTVYPAAAQAAEYYLRQQTNELGIDAYRMADATESEPGDWQVRFVSNQTGKQYQYHLIAQKTETTVFEGCTLDKQTSVIRYHLLSE